MVRHTDESQQESACNNTTKALDLASQSGDKAPYHNTDANVNRRPTHVVEKEIGWNLHDEIPDKKYGQTSLVLLIGEVEIGHQALKFRRGIIVSCWSVCVIF